ncbi:hypothetical protein QQP08_027042 [Theobroma cacao]|nr:hypothetical protein QQP08_027042 [Theobroma cacao]
MNKAMQKRHAPAPSKHKTIKMRKRYPKIQNPATVFSGIFSHEETNTHYWDSKSSNRSLIKGNLRKKGEWPYSLEKGTEYWKIEDPLTDPKTTQTAATHKGYYEASRLVNPALLIMRTYIS